MFHKTAKSKVLSRAFVGPLFKVSNGSSIHVPTRISSNNSLEIIGSQNHLFISRFYSKSPHQENSNVEKAEVEVEEIQEEKTSSSYDKQFSGLSEAALEELKQLKSQDQEESVEESSEAPTDYGFSSMSPQELMHFLPEQNKETLYGIASFLGLPNVSKRTQIHDLRNLLMHYKLHPDDPVFKNVKKVVIPPIIPKSAYKKKYWGRQWMYTPEEAKRWPTVKYILRDVRSSPKKMYITADFIKGMQLKEAVDQLILWRKKTNILTARFLWSCMKISEHNYSFVQDDILIKDAVVEKGLFLKRMRYHGKMKFGIMKRRRCNLVVTLCEVPRSNPNQKIGRFGWRPETWRKFEEKYPEIIAQMEQRETLEREAAIRWRDRVKNLTEEQKKEERLKLVEEYKGYFKEDSKLTTFDLLEEPIAV